MAHGSSLRALVSILDSKFDDESIKNFNIPSAIPIVISVNKDLEPLKYEYIGDESEIIYRMEKIKNETKKKINI